MLKTDILVIGSGIAGLSFALKTAKLGKVTIVTKDKIQESNTLYAQGGLAAVFSKNDSFEEHIKNTLRAGDGLCNKQAVITLVKNAPKEILWLEDIGVKFDRNGKFHLSKEAVHSKARIVHAGDITGGEVEKVLVKNIKKNNRIKVLQFNQAIELIVKNKKCYGAIILDIKKNKIHQINSKTTILATGGLGQIYKNTSNPETATGDGFALAYNAGASLQDMEFVQFHPTSLYKSPFLISETLRGEGGHLRNKYGEIYMPRYHRDGELAPRDVVSKFTVDEIKKTKTDHVYLDITHMGSKYIKKRFPKIYKKCLKHNIDITKQPIPVTPTAHYSCGGVKIDLNGKTDIKNLFAIGEVSCSGLHGADRLASNSLTDGLVFGKRLSDYLKNNKELFKDNPIKKIKINYKIIKNINKVLRNKIKNLMWDKVGIIRNQKNLNLALNELNTINNELKKITKNGINKDIIELKNMLITAKLITKSALKRKESRGTHFIREFPMRNDKKWQKHSIVNKEKIKFC